MAKVAKSKTKRSAASKAKVKTKTKTKRAAKKTVSKKKVKKKVAKKKVVKKKATVKRKATNTKAKVSVRKKRAAASSEVTDATIRKIWLAGLGAYGMSVDQLQRRSDEVKESSQQFFEDLVKRGTAVQERTSERVNKRIDSLEDRIDEIKDQLSEGYTSSPWGKKVGHLAGLLEELQEKRK